MHESKFHGYDRSKKWKPVPWAELRHGDTITFYEEGRFTARKVDHHMPDGTVLTQPMMYERWTVHPAIKVYNLTQREQDAYIGRKRELPPIFRGGERRATKKFRPLVADKPMRTGKFVAIIAK